jgi:RNA polymerase sigma-70 factor (ECF subfamily)
MSAARDTRAAEAAPTAEEFGGFFREHHGFVWRTARRLGAPAEAIDDVVQDVFLAVHRQGDRFEGRSSVKTWLFAITANTVRMHRRREVRRQRRVEAAGGLVVAPPRRDEAEQHAAVDLIDRLIRKLDADLRNVFVLIELEDVAPKDVARAFALSINTVHSRLRLARKRLQIEVRRMKARQEAGR